MAGGHGGYRKGAGRKPPPKPPSVADAFGAIKQPRQRRPAVSKDDARNQRKKAEEKSKKIEEEKVRRAATNAAIQEQYEESLRETAKRVFQLRDTIQELGIQGGYDEDNDDYIPPDEIDYEKDDVDDVDVWANRLRTARPVQRRTQRRRREPAADTNHRRILLYTSTFTNSKMRSCVSRVLSATTPLLNLRWRCQGISVQRSTTGKRGCTSSIHLLQGGWMTARRSPSNADVSIAERLGSLNPTDGTTSPNTTLTRLGGCCIAVSNANPGMVEAAVEGLLRKCILCF